MISKHLIIIILTLFCENLSAQKEDYQWLFNWSRVDDCTQSNLPEICGASVLDFNQLPPKFYRNESITLDVAECNASICDENGQFLFYSNGQSIHGHNHEPILNGEKINYTPKWDWLTWENENGEEKPQGLLFIQATGFIKIPEGDSTFLCLYNNYEDLCTNGNYELWTGLIRKSNVSSFEIINKDEILKHNISKAGSIHSCTHANGRDQWLLQFSQDTVFAFLIDPAGIRLDHFQILPIKIKDSNGQSKFSPGGDKFALYGIQKQESNTGMDLFISDFNRCTGSIVNPQYTQLESSDAALISNGLEFSSDGTLLYISKLNKIIQYDLLSSSIFNSAKIVSNYEAIMCELGFVNISFGQLQLGPDKRIYIGNASQCFQLGLIEFPNKVGAECNVIQNAIKLPTYHQSTIPNFNTYRLGPLDGSPCDTLGQDNNPISKFWYEQDSTDHQQIQFRDVSYFRPEEWSWNFGDGNSSEEMNPLHTYQTNGIYEVCLTVSNENSSNTSCQVLQIGTTSNHNLKIDYDITFYPNPVEDLVRFVFHNYLPENAIIKLYNFEGKEIFQERLYQESIINLSALIQGAYLFEINDGSKNLKQGKIIKR